jgi:hypothetical protein
MKTLFIAYYIRGLQPFPLAHYTNLTYIFLQFDVPVHLCFKISLKIKKNRRF